ncbi:hypothetical protein [Campylobacter lanienae]|nr:hypothetical protein [Campylobacter lanienae]
MAVAILLPWLEILRAVTLYLLWIIGQTIIIIVESALRKQNES